MNEIVNDNITISNNLKNNTINDDFLEEDNNTTIIVVSVIAAFILFCVFCNRNEERDRQDMIRRAQRAQGRLEIRYGN